MTLEAADRRAAPTRGPRGGHPFLWYAARRLITAVLLLVGVTLVTFVLTNLVPGDPVAAAVGQRAAEDPQIVARFRAEYGLDKSVPAQYLTYLNHLLHGNLGVSSTTHNDVTADLGKALPATLEIALAAIVLSVIMGVVLGTLAAYRRGRVTDQVLRVVSVVGLSVPTFWLALVLYYVFFFKLHLAPGSGRLSPDFNVPPTHTGLYTVDALLAGQPDTFADAAAHLFLPVVVLTLYTVGLLTRFVRTAVLEVLDQDYVRAARAKGLSGRRVVTAYVLRGASIPILTVVGLAFGSLLSGTVLVEAVFAWPGIGSYAYNAASHLDLPGVMGVGLLIGVVYLVVNLLVDLAYAALDPRVRLS